MVLIENFLLQISIFFDLIFMCQHFLLYPARRAVIASETSKETELFFKSVDHPMIPFETSKEKESLIKSLDHPESEMF